MDKIPDDVRKDIELRFSYRGTPLGNRERYQAVREGARDLALLVVRACPPGRERSLALTKLEESMHWTNTGISIHRPEAGYQDVFEHLENQHLTPEKESP